MTSVITKAGISAAIRAGSGGALININHFKIGPTQIVPDEGMTDASLYTSANPIGGVPYIGSPDSMAYRVIDENTTSYVIILDEHMGDFTIGNVGLFLDDGTLFSITSYSFTSLKRKSVGANPGNRRILTINIKYSNLATISNFTIQLLELLSLPEVPTEFDLPTANLAPFNTYQVRGHTVSKIQTIAYTWNNRWHFGSERDLSGSGDTIIPLEGIAFDDFTDIGEICAVNWDNNKYIVGDPDDKAHPPVGVRSGPYHVTTIGLYQDTRAEWIPGQKLYIGAGSDKGKFVTVDNGYPIGWVLKPTLAWIDFSNALRVAIPGPIGLQGERGFTGATGATGAKGDKGETGAQGLQGIQGFTGAQGIPGPAGRDGVPGPPGQPGQPGQPGATGAQGPQGPQGPSGSSPGSGLVIDGISVGTYHWAMNFRPSEYTWKYPGAYGGLYLDGMIPNRWLYQFAALDLGDVNQTSYAYPGTWATRGFTGISRWSDAVSSLCIIQRIA
jgi:hypothetical protein